MGRRTRALNGRDGEIVPIGVEPPSEDRPPPKPTSRSHSAAVAGAAICAVGAILAFVGFVTVNWAGRSRRVVIAVMMFCVLGFLASTVIAILSAARDTYARKTAN